MGRPLWSRTPESHDAWLDVLHRWREDNPTAKGAPFKNCIYVDGVYGKVLLGVFVDNRKTEARGSKGSEAAQDAARALVLRIQEVRCCANTALQMSTQGAFRGCSIPRAILHTPTQVLGLDEGWWHRRRAIDELPKPKSDDEWLDVLRRWRKDNPTSPRFPPQGCKYKDPVHGVVRVGGFIQSRKIWARGMQGGEAAQAGARALMPRIQEVGRRMVVLCTFVAC